MNGLEKFLDTDDLTLLKSDSKTSLRERLMNITPANSWSQEGTLPRAIPKNSKDSQNRSELESIARNEGEKTHSGNEEEEVFEEFSIDSTNWLFEKNQNSEITIHNDGVIEVTVLQEGSTPGIKSQIPIPLKEGEYILTAVAHADAESTFFPWAMDSSKVRLTPTVHIPTQEEPVSVPVRVDQEGEIIVGILCHRQELGDKCYISSLHISKVNNSSKQIFEGKIPCSNLISILSPHQNTVLDESSNGTIVRSKPISTPGTYAIVPVKPLLK